MKKLTALFIHAIMCMFLLVSCNVNYSGDTNFTVREDDDSFSMHADFNRNKTTDVDEYMDKRIGSRSNMSFVNSRIDGKMAFDDHTTFYIKKYPGFLEIKLDKAENTNEAYRRVKSMCQGIKKIITE